MSVHAGTPSMVQRIESAVPTPSLSVRTRARARPTRPGARRSAPLQGRPPVNTAYCLLPTGHATAERGRGESPVTTAWRRASGGRLQAGTRLLEGSRHFWHRASWCSSRPCDRGRRAAMAFSGLPPSAAPRCRLGHPSPNRHPGCGREKLARTSERQGQRPVSCRARCVGAPRWQARAPVRSGQRLNGCVTIVRESKGVIVESRGRAGEGHACPRWIGHHGATPAAQRPPPIKWSAENGGKSPVERAILWVAPLGSRRICTEDRSGCCSLRFHGREFSPLQPPIPEKN